MGYASFANQLFQMLHYAFSFLLLMVIWPRYLFPRVIRGLPGDRRVALFQRAVLLYILIGYVLVLCKLFEVLGIVAILLLLTFRQYFKRGADKQRAGFLTRLALLFYETLDVGFRLRHWTERAQIRWQKRRQRPVAEQRDWQTVWERVLLALVLLGAAYLRFYDAWTSPTPAMSDGYVTLAWMKYINERILFHDGIYPQGFHIVLATLQKFAAIDPLYVLKYTGPLDGVLITFGLYYATSRWSGNRFAGIAAAIVYGLAGESLHGQDWARQAATNSQEFAMVFALPCVYFLARYLKEGEREDLWTGSCGLAITGMVHSLVFGYAGLLLLIAMGVSTITRFRESKKRLRNLVISGTISVVLAVIPLGVGKLLGQDVHSNSEDFLTSRINVSPPPLGFWDKAALLSLALCVVVFFLRREPLKEKAFQLSGLLLVAGSCVLYEYGAVVSHSLVLEERGPSLWALAIPFSIGLGLHALLHGSKWVPWRKALQAVCCLCLIGFMVKQTHLQPIQPYKMEWDAEVEQYLKIASEYRPMTWMMITDHTEGYDVMLGEGYHMYISDMLANYDPTQSALTKFGANKPDQNIPDDLFIVNEKQVFEVSEHNVIYKLLAPDYTMREIDNVALDEWMQIYKAHHYTVQIYYEDAHIRIYHLHKQANSTEQQEKIWGGAP